MELGSKLEPQLLKMDEKEIIEIAKDEATKQLLAKLKPALMELIKKVPDIDDPARINYWETLNGYSIYLEGWSDECLAGTGFPPIESGEWDEKVAYMEDLTPQILRDKAKEYGLELIGGGFIEKTEEDYPEHLYGVTYGVYKVAPASQRTPIR